MSILIKVYIKFSRCIYSDCTFKFSVQSDIQVFLTVYHPLPFLSLEFYMKKSEMDTKYIYYRGK